ncbi:MAG: response regulator [Chloroflexi bacterium]|nr:response regulator [Chloroflexota bacterium]
MRHTFEGEGFQVSCVSDACSAVQILETDVPYLVLLDVVTPGKGGCHVLRHITRRALGIPVVSLTAKSEKVETAEALGLGADDRVAKPFSTQSSWQESRASCAGSIATQQPMVIMPGRKCRCRGAIAAPDGKCFPTLQRNLPKAFRSRFFPIR